LQFDGNVLQHMAQPGAAILPHPADEAARTRRRSSRAQPAPGAPRAGRR
jgi:hypothetical protein